MALDQSQYLNVLARVTAETLKPFVDDLLPKLGRPEVLESRTGLVMLPYEEPVHGKTFHLGEVLMAEGRVRLNEAEGYGACLGRDVHQALAIAILDAALQGGLERDTIAAFVQQEAAQQAQEDEDVLRKVEATRVEMETF